MGERLAVCIPTYRRPERLAALLAALAELRFELGPEPDVAVLVVDNDAEGSAAAVCRGVPASFRWRLRYLQEPERGLARVRNRLLEEARQEGSDYAAFIDDDEVPSPAWLDAMLAARRRFGADVVVGPVLPRFSSEPPRWVLEGGFFERSLRETGARLGAANSGNTLLKMSMLRGLGGFDRRYDLTGGEDTEFFMRAAKQGRVMVYCREGEVYEAVGPERANAGFLLRRSFCSGNIWARCRLQSEPGLGTRLGLAAKGLAQVAAAAIAVLPAACLGRRRLVRVCLFGADGLGMCLGVVGFSFEGYR